MANIFDVAKYILERRGSMSTMKLQKLCYYSQVWSLVWDDEPLFQETFEAWANGPVCPELFHLHQRMFKVSAADIPTEYCQDDLTVNQKDTVNQVLDHYGLHDAQWLSTLTHMERPWQDARQGVAPGESCNNVISTVSMAEYYSGL